MDFKDGGIEGVRVERLTYHSDGRGWLCELFRFDELPPEMRPEMGYVSMSLPGARRGPHMHREQTDYFAFISSEFRVVLWDAREGSPTYGNRRSLMVGKENPSLMAIPPGVVHAYINTGAEDGLVLNFPNRLYAGRGRKEPVDEVRYEDLPGGVYRIEE